MRKYTQKYGKETKAWPLAVKFQLLFETLPVLCTICHFNSIFAGTLCHVVSELSGIENSGVVQKYYKVKDRQWSDSIECKYTCGRYLLDFTEYTEIKKTYIDTDWYLSVTKNDVISDA